MSIIQGRVVQLEHAGHTDDMSDCLTSCINVCKVLHQQGVLIQMKKMHQKKKKVRSILLKQKHY